MKTKRTVYNVNDIALARVMLKEARGLLRRAGARKSADYVQRSIKSVSGALNHAQRMSGGTRSQRANARMWAATAAYLGSPAAEDEYNAL